MPCAKVRFCVARVQNLLEEAVAQSLLDYLYCLFVGPARLGRQSGEPSQAAFFEDRLGASMIDLA